MDELMRERIEQLRVAKARASEGGGKEKVEREHAKGKLSARERIELLLDPGSFTEFGMLTEHLAGAPGDGIITGYGTIQGRLVCVYSQDPTVRGGSIGGVHGYKMYKTVERALQMGVPLIGLHDSPGARLPRPSEGESAFGAGLLNERSGLSIFYPNTQASGVIPQIAAILGSCAGISVYSPALNDFILMVDKTSHMFITGPAMVKATVWQEVTAEELGGAKVHCTVSGVADLRLPTEKECLEKIRELILFLPSNNQEKPPRLDSGDDPDRLDDTLADVVPSDPNKPYDVREVITRIVDQGYFFEIKPEFAGEIVVGFGRLDGQTVGIVANQPLVRAGSLTADSSDKQARFIRFCDCFNIPLILLVDTPAYMPGTYQEHAGIIRHGAKVLYALCEAVVPRVAVMLRKCYGGGNLGMGIAPGLATDLVYCWPIVEMGVLGAEQSVALFYGEEIKKAENPTAAKEARVKEYREKYANPIYEISSNRYFEDVIEPRETRRQLIKSLRFLASKKTPPGYPKRHGNIPL